MAMRDADPSQKLHKINRDSTIGHGAEHGTVKPASRKRGYTGASKGHQGDILMYGDTLAPDTNTRVCPISLNTASAVVIWPIVCYEIFRCPNRNATRTATCRSVCRS